MIQPSQYSRRWNSIAVQNLKKLSPTLFHTAWQVENGIGLPEIKSCTNPSDKGGEDNPRI